MVFASRKDAGQKLGRFLAARELRVDVVLGLPRGGVVVAAEVARRLGARLDVLVVRKLGHPLHREFAVGALAEGDVVVLDEAVIGANPIVRHELEGVLREEKDRLKSYQARFHQGGVMTAENKLVLLVDDGLATGATTEAAVLSARKQHARRITVAAPVASTHAVERLQKVADEVIALHVDPWFDAVGRYYDEFSQTTDEEVSALLRAG
ncbi:MAG TPA: phosphoribosyltransferase family protein [Verrucomicrobiae bacterium]